MIHFQKLSEKQAEKLKRLHKLMSIYCRKSYTVSTGIYIDKWGQGIFSYICRNAGTSRRTNRLIHKIAPHVRIHIKKGHGWHYLDSTPYFIGHFDFQIF